MTVNQIDPYDDLMSQGYSEDEARFISDQVYRDWVERTRIYR